ncbi:EAL domain-containing protein [Nodosilinea sp. LEGE 06152]|uniref:EAL domain-containing protein n=1 Tax=Nodosilinea sp. LEGE 06152 TaxID=2777966 RepID=UPI00187E361F|nr:EAL domain-containing protein [Nodosilinea sp. LEGE 06152]MBE9157585.1 EAL domain-containing protein [Nodosilinea sp. LEGE 06152]
MKNIASLNGPLVAAGVVPAEAVPPDHDSSALVADIAVSPECTIRLFSAGDTIFTEGSSADRAYIIESGYVEIFVGSGEDSLQLSVLGPGDIFGEMGIIDAAPRSASAKAICPCRCIVVSAAQVAERIESSSPMVRLFISMSLHRNRAYNAYLKALATPHVGLPRPAVSEKTYAKNQQYQQILDDIKLEADLQNAVRNDELFLVYQPLLNLHNRRVIGFESLLRWQCPQRGLVNPQQFIALAEETTLILPMGDWILEHSCADLRRFQDQLDRIGQSSADFFISINISVRQFQQPDFFDRLMACTQRHQVKAQQIKLEVTERVFLDEIEAIDSIGKCRAAGFEVSLDDFGTGYSSLNYLERCEIDCLKIDRSFIQKLCTSDRAKILVSAIIDIARQLGLPTVAEGIETPAQMVALQAMGCEIGQGFLFSHPLPLTEALGLVGQPLAIAPVNPA